MNLYALMTVNGKVETETTDGRLLVFTSRWDAEQFQNQMTYGIAKRLTVEEFHQTPKLEKLSIPIPEVPAPKKSSTEDCPF